MPTTDQPKRQTVEIAPGVSVEIPDFWEVIWRDDGAMTKVHVVIDPDDRRPRYAGRFDQPAKPLLADEVDDERIQVLLQAAVSQNAAKVAADRMVAALGTGWAVGSRLPDLIPGAVIPEGWPVLDQNELDRIGRAAAATVAPKLGRRPVTDERKLEILELYRTKGIEQTKSITGLAESTIRHHVTAARRIERGER